MASTSIFHASSFREWPYNYGDFDDHLGYEAFVVSQSGQMIRIIRHRLKYIEAVEMTLEEFTARYSPDFTLSPRQMAREFINFLTFMQATLDVREIISSHSKINYSDREFHMASPKKTAQKPDKAKTTNFVRVRTDSHRRTCIVIKDGADQIEFIPLSKDGFDIETMGRGEFLATYKNPLEDYPVDRAARLYVEYAMNLGASKEAMKALAQLTTVTDREITMATTKQANKGAAKAAAAEKTKAEKVKKDTKVAEKAKAEKPAPAAKKPTARQQSAAVKKAKGVSASQRFQDLIMEGKLSDDKIFETVQKEFGLDDSKRSYVRWYRNNLIKQGKNPPAAK